MPHTDPIAAFDCEAIYDTQISPLITQLITICKEHDIPMVASFLYAADGEGGEDYCHTVINEGPHHAAKFNTVARILMSDGPVGSLVVRVSRDPQSD